VRPEHHGGASGIAAFTLPALRAAWGWYLFGYLPFMTMPVASKRKIPASLEAVDAVIIYQLFLNRAFCYLSTLFNSPYPNLFIANDL